MRALCIAFAGLLAACGGGGSAGGGFAPPSPHSAPSGRPSQAITHIVVIVQENRTVDNLFQGFPGADTAAQGPSASGMVNLTAIPLTAPFDIHHTHPDFKAAYAKGAMNGWNNEVCEGKCPLNAAYGYVPQSEVQPYWTLAQQYGFANYMFQTQQGPSFPAHQYLVSGTSAIATGAAHRASENPAGLVKDIGGCDSPSNALVTTIDQAGHEGAPVFPCFDRSSIFTLLDGAGLTWKFYQANAGSGLWNAVDALEPLCPSAPCNGNPEYAANVVTPSAQVLADVANGQLANVTFVTPTFASSDHAGVTDGTGPDWVASVVNAIGSSKFWDSTAIIFTYDDWGGWYDHCKPTIYDSYTDGFRVPLLVISPYVKRGYISNTRRDFGSILKFIESNFGLPSLGTSDSRADDLSDFFNLSVGARHFKRIPTKHGAAYFLSRPRTSQPPDND